LWNPPGEGSASTAIALLGFGVWLYDFSAWKTCGFTRELMWVNLRTVPRQIDQ
jgi:hypothetical protein